MSLFSIITGRVKAIQEANIVTNEVSFAVVIHDFDLVLGFLCKVRTRVTTWRLFFKSLIEV